jgi:ornithine cyclodeaminase/alanine dehydrogenase-like protein (mu-crystallin family)
MLYLGEKELMKDLNFNYLKIMDAIEEAYAIDLAGTYVMPERIHLDYEGNTLLYMPCFLKKSFFGTKYLTLFPGNSEKNKPVIEGLYILNDPECGSPLAIINGATMTAIRTGAVGAVAIRHTTPDRVKSLGLIGAGVQNYFQALFATRTRRFEEINIFDLTAAKATQLCNRLNEHFPGLSINASASVEELLDRSEVIITATPATRPVLPDDKALLQNRHYIGIGSYKPEMREYPEALYRLVNQVLIDTDQGLVESGDLITPLRENWLEENQIIKFAGYIAGRDKNQNVHKTTFFKSVGMALFDLTVAKCIYQEAMDKKIGIVLDAE